MKYNIHVYLNKITKDLSEDFKKAREYYLKNGVDLAFTFEKVSVSGYTSQWYPNLSRYLVTGSECLVTPKGDATMFVFNQSDWKTPKGSPFPLRTDCPTGNCFLSNAKPFINVGYFDTTHKMGLVYIEIIHELMHAMVLFARLAGVQVKDTMDDYIKNNPEQYLDSDSNFSRQWVFLKPFLMKPKVIIKRTYQELQTPGELTATIGGATFSCKSLELPWKQNQRNISCIPAGTYQVDWAFSPSRMRWTYRLQNVPGRSGILFHSGNYAYKKTGEPDINGCILLGSAFADINGDKVPDIANSKNTVEAFERFMGKQSFTLEIV